MNDFLRIGALALAAVACEPANGQWTVTNLNPPGATSSGATAIAGVQQVGSAFVDGVGRASLWTGTPTSWISLHPAGAVASQAYATSGDHQVGWVVAGGRDRASLWSGTSTSWVDLSPAGATGSYAYAVDGGQQAGWAEVGGVQRASLWSGTAASWVDLHPEGAAFSYAYAIGGGRQAGVAYIAGQNRASLWSGTAASWVSLHPPGADGSEVWATNGLQQVGVVAIGGLNRASLWSGTPGSWVDLHPAGTRLSKATAIDGSQQAGFVFTSSNVPHAALWSGTAESWVDLHAMLPVEFASSEATGISSDANATRITGFGYDNLTGRYEALLWTLVICDPPVITSLLADHTACEGETTSFHVAAIGTSPQLQWRRNEVDIPSANTATYTIPSVTLAAAGTYDCIITNACGTATSNPATLTVRTPQILTQPTSQTVNVDQPVFFALEADPQSPCFSALSYRWQRRNPLVENEGAPNAWLDLSDGGGFAGSHSPSLAIFRPTPGLATGFRCKITNACGCEADANGVIYTSTVNFAAACPSDFNNDGGVDGDDVIEFFERWDAGC